MSNLTALDILPRLAVGFRLDTAVNQTQFTVRPTISTHAGGVPVLEERPKKASRAGNPPWFSFEYNQELPERLSLQVLTFLYQPLLVVLPASGLGKHLPRQDASGRLLSRTTERAGMSIFQYWFVKQNQMLQARLFDDHMHCLRFSL